VVTGFAGQVYVGSPLVAQVFVYGDSLQAVLVGIVVPDEEQVKKWAADNNISGSSLADWVKNPALKAAVQKDMDRVAKEGKVGFGVVWNFLPGCAR
jgi:long-chain acyl-CoA synthetase